MSSLLKKIKKRGIDKVRRETVLVLKAKEAAERLVKANDDRIKAYCECMVLPCFAYVMRQEFRWGALRINNLYDRIEYIVSFFREGAERHQVWVTIPWL